MAKSEGLTTNDFEFQKQYFRSHSPTCLSDFKAELVKPNRPGEPDEALDSAWVIRCECGSSDFHGLMYAFINPGHSTTEPIYVSPVTLACIACSRENVIFDSKKHGYNPVACGQDYTIYGPDEESAKHVTFACPNCGNQKLKYISRFNYPDDLHSDSFSEYRGIEQDLFDNIALIFACPACRKAAQFADFECS